MDRASEARQVSRVHVAASGAEVAGRETGTKPELELSCVVETALAKALLLAAKAERGDVAEQLATELGTRRGVRTREAVAAPEERHGELRRNQFSRRPDRL